MAGASSSFVLIFLVSIISIPCFINAASLSDACTKAAASSPNINRDFCIGSLQADPKSASANFIGLAQIATELTSKNATKTQATIKSLLINPANDKTKEALNTCLDLYVTMIGSVSDAAKAISSLHYGDALTYLSAALDAPDDCEDAFSQLGVATLLAKEDANAKQLCAIALAFLDL